MIAGKGFDEGAILQPIFGFMFHNYFLRLHNSEKNVNFVQLNRSIFRSLKISEAIIPEAF